MTYRSTVTIIMTIIGVLMVFFHMLSTQVQLWDNFEFQSIHLIFIFALIGLSQIIDASPLKSLYMGSVTILGILCALYVATHIPELDLQVGFPTSPTLWLGVALIFCVFEMTRWVWGIALPTVAGVFVVYYLFGQYLPSIISHADYPVGYIVSDLSVGLTGIFGMFLDISASQVFLFVVFGALLEIARVNEFFFEVGNIPGRVLRGGPGHTAVVSSSLIGMVTGAAVANVAITGSFTIPFMKKMGYPNHYAGAIEATASTGGQIMPPVMGASAFLMAAFLGVPYRDVMIAGVIPAMLYYIGVMGGVQFLATRLGLPLAPTKINIPIIIRRGPVFLIPLGVMVWLLLRQYSPALAAFWAINMLIFLVYLDPSIRPNYIQLLRCASRGAIMGAKIGISLAIVGIIAQTLISTDLGTKFSAIVLLVSQGSLPIILAMTAVVTLILGCGVPTSAAYTLVAIIVLPTIIKAGIAPMAGHFYVFYYAVISAVTPPVAMAALAAAGIAGAGYMKTAVSAFLLSSAGFIIPLFIIIEPEILLESGITVSLVVSVFVMAVSIISLSSLIFRAMIIKNNVIENILMLLALGASSTFLINLNRLGDRLMLLSAFGLLIVYCGVIVNQVYRKRRQEERRLAGQYT